MKEGHIYTIQGRRRFPREVQDIFDHNYWRSLHYHQGYEFHKGRFAMFWGAGDLNRASRKDFAPVYFAEKRMVDFFEFTEVIWRVQESVLVKYPAGWRERLKNLKIAVIHGHRHCYIDILGYTCCNIGDGPKRVVYGEEIAYLDSKDVPE